MTKLAQFFVTSVRFARRIEENTLKKRISRLFFVSFLSRNWYPHSLDDGKLQFFSLLSNEPVKSKGLVLVRYQEDVDSKRRIIRILGISCGNYSPTNLPVFNWLVPTNYIRFSIFVLLLFFPSSNTNLRRQQIFTYFLFHHSSKCVYKS